MKVRELMTGDVSYCQPTTTLADAAMMMWRRDCGVVPVVDEQKRVVGMITDRDVCMAVATKNRLANDILASEVIFGKVEACEPNDDVEKVLKKMKKKQLRRLPVTSKDGVLLGIVSISDLLHASGSKGKEIKKKLLIALREISTFRPPHLHELAAEKAVVETNKEEMESDETETENLTKNPAEDSKTNTLDVNLAGIQIENEADGLPAEAQDETEIKSES